MDHRSPPPEVLNWSSRPSPSPSPPPLMADVHSHPLSGRNVVAHHCQGCTCPDVDDNNALRRNGTDTDTSLLLPAGWEHSGASVRSGAGYLGGAGGVVPPVNGHVQVDVGALTTQSDSGVSRSDEDTDEDDGLCVADVVATNLEELNSGRYPKLKLAYDDWEKAFETFQKRREYKEAQRDAIRNEIYQVIGFYIVFQGVIFTAVAQASVLRCRNWWTSFLLSLLTSLVTIGVVLQKLSGFWALETTIASEKLSSKVLNARIKDVKLRVGPRAFDFKKHALDGKAKDAVEPGVTVRLYRFAVISMLLCFSALFLLSSWNILCRPGHAPTN